MPGPAAAAPSSGSDEQRLGPGQEALFFLHRRSPLTSEYNISTAFRLAGALDVSALRNALQALVRRHSALRSVSGARGGELYFRVLPDVEVDFTEEEATQLDEAAFRRRLDDEANRPFELEARPPLRVRVFNRPANERVLLLSVHHVIANFASLSVLAEELGQHYSALSGGRPAPTLAVPICRTRRGSRPAA